MRKDFAIWLSIISLILQLLSLIQAQINNNRVRSTVIIEYYISR